MAKKCSVGKIKIKGKVINVERHDPICGGYGDNILSIKTWIDGRMREITFYHLIGKKGWGTEVYAGPNYIVGARGKSYSRNYKGWKNLPDKYKDIAQKLKNLHNKTYK